MSSLIAKVFVAMLAKLVTEKFFSKTIVYSLRAIAKSTDNKLDDQIVWAVAEALDVKILVQVPAPQPKAPEAPAPK